MISSRAESDAKLQPLFGLCKFLTLFLKKFLQFGFWWAFARLWLGCKCAVCDFASAKLVLFLEMGKCFFDFFGGGWVHIIYIGVWVMDLFGFWIFGWILGGFRGMKEIKKSGGGDVRAGALAWDDEWDKT